MTVRILAAALALAGAAAPLAAQPDTLRLGRPPAAGRDTLAPRAPTFTPIADTAGDFDAPATRDLVRRVIRAGSVVPAELQDYRASLSSAVTLSLRADSAQGGELPVTVDEFAGEVRWARGGSLLQRIRGHRVRLLAPTPYTIGSMLEAPWVVPHLYGNTISVFQLSSTGGRGRVASAVHPFSERGLSLYRYEGGDTIRVRTQVGTTRLVPVEVRPRPGVPADTLRLVAGTFWIDADRAAIARARFGFTEREGGLLVSETGVFFELENGLVGDRYWLPFRQRREVQVSSPLFGGAVAVRLVTGLSGFELNTGWTPEEPRAYRLVWDLAGGDSLFAGFARAVGDEAGRSDITDFADLRAAVRPPPEEGGPVRVAFRADRGDHFFRYNRVEGAFVGGAVRVEPRDPEARDWSVYAHAGWAFAEGTARGELSARWHPAPASPLHPAWSATAGVYRRLRDVQVFRPVFQWDLGYTLGAAISGYDVRDYYDAAGAELFAVRRRGPWTWRVGARWEEQDSVSRNTEQYLLGGSAGDFPLVAPADPGTHAAVETDLRYGRGAGAFGLAGSVIAGLSAEAGLGDFRTGRATALLTTRLPGRWVTLVARGDAGVVVGEAPPQFLFRFGGDQGLRGYDRNEFGGTVAALGRARMLLHLPPYGTRPLVRAGYFLVPPLRPALVLSGDAGWSDVSDDSADALLRIGARTTEGTRWSYGAGMSIFEDAVSAEFVWPGDGGEGKWYFGFVRWF